jgi:hypothetical protein
MALVGVGLLILGTGAFLYAPQMSGGERTGLYTLGSFIVLGGLATLIMSAAGGRKF